MNCVADMTHEFRVEVHKMEERTYYRLTLIVWILDVKPTSGQHTCPLLVTAGTRMGNLTSRENEQ